MCSSSFATAQILSTVGKRGVWKLVEALKKKVIDNNYPSNKIVMGMLSEDVVSNFCYTYNVVKNLSNTYKNFGGVFIWEYYNAPPNANFPILWSYYMYSALNNYSNCLN